MVRKTLQQKGFFQSFSDPLYRLACLSAFMRKQQIMGLDVEVIGVSKRLAHKQFHVFSGKSLVLIDLYVTRICKLQVFPLVPVTAATLELVQQEVATLKTACEANCHVAINTPPKQFVQRVHQISLFIVRLFLWNNQQ